MMRRDMCSARLSLILPGDDYPSVVENCEKRVGHQDYHGTLGGYCWHTSDDGSCRAVNDGIPAAPSV